MRPLLAVALVVSLLATACSLPTDESAQLIDVNDLPDALRSDLTTTTTTIEPPSAVTIGVFLIDLADERKIVIEVAREVEATASLFDQLSLLFGDEVRNEAERDLGYSNPLGEFTLTSAVRNENDVAIIDIIALDEAGNEVAVDADVLRDAAAQLVYTAIGFSPTVAVRILINGERVVLPTTGEAGDTEGVLNKADYERYLPEFEPPPPTTVPETSTTTEAPPADDG